MTKKPLRRPCLPRRFYNRPTLEVAADLLGKVLVRHAPAGTTAGIIVEAEAYVGEDDPACHAAPGPTPRNQPLYGPPGYAYVYLNYGMHDLFNVVTEPPGSPAAVLVRALDPIDGIAIMRARRASKADKTGGTDMSVDALCRGPGNLTRAMGITLADNRVDLCGDVLYIEDRGLKVGPIVWSPRIGVKVGTEPPWRCFIGGHPAVSTIRAARAAKRLAPRAKARRASERSLEPFGGANGLSSRAGGVAPAQSKNAGAPRAPSGPSPRPSARLRGSR